MATVEHTDDTIPGDGVRRRDFINIAAVSAAGAGAVITLVPLVSQMAPSKDVLAESTTEVDLTAENFYGIVNFTAKIQNLGG
jgi:ubiquinol-cytochrome c reductase iron-sulfur subunit